MIEEPEAAARAVNPGSATSAATPVQRQGGKGQGQVQVPTMADLANMMFAMANQRPGKGQGKGRTGPGGRGNKFMFRGCWECGAADHSRHQCEKWLKILDKDGRPPAGHKGAKDKAKDAWQKKRSAAKAAKDKAAGLVAALTGAAPAPTTQSGDNTEDEDWTESEDEGNMFGCAFNDRLGGRSWQEVLAGEMSDSDVEDSDEPDPGPREGVRVIRPMPKMPKRQSQSVRRKQANQDRLKSEVVIQSEADLDSQDLIHALPKDEKSLRRIARNKPRLDHLRKGEIWVMADSGSTLHAIDVKKELPDYAHLVRPSQKHRGRSAETACGGKVEIDGELELSGLIGDDAHTITFNDMKVSMPICSLRKIVKAGNVLHIAEDGGHIYNRRTKQKIELHERCGVYFFKFQLFDPVDQTQKRASDFHRPA